MNTRTMSWTRPGGALARSALVLLLALVGSTAEIAVDATVPWIDEDGWTPVVLQVSHQLPGTVPVTITGRLGDSQGEIHFQLAPGDRVRRTLLVPTTTNETQVHLRWRTPGLDLGETTVSCQNFRSFDVAFVDPEEQVPYKELLTQVQARIKEPPRSPREPSWRHSSGKGYPDERFHRMGGETLPDRWQGYPLWLTLVVSSSGERRLDLGQREAIAAWSRTGGVLLVGDASQLATWKSLGAQVAVVTAEGLGQRLEHLTSLDSYRPERLKIPGTGDLPVIGFAIIAVLFALLAGPVSFIWAARRGQRALVLVIVPVLSVVTCVLLIIYGLYADGLSTRRVTVQGMLLDQAAGRCLVATGFSLFAGLAPGSVPVHPDERLIPFDTRLFGGNSWRDQEASPHLTLSADGQFAGLVPARQVSQFLSVRSTSERRRLLLTRHGQGWQVTNGFDLPLVDVLWTDGSGTGWALGVPALAPGETVDLAPADPEHHLASPGAELGMEWTLEKASFMDAKGSPLPGVYSAKFAGALIPPPGPKASDLEPITTRVYGRPAPDGERP